MYNSFAIQHLLKFSIIDMLAQLNEITNNKQFMEKQRQSVNIYSHDMDQNRVSIFVSFQKISNKQHRIEGIACFLFVF